MKEEIVPQNNPMVQFDTTSAPSHPLRQSGLFNGQAIWKRPWVWSTGGGGEAEGRRRVEASLTPPPHTSRPLFLLFSDLHSLVWKQRIVRLTTADIFLKLIRKDLTGNVTKFYFIFLCEWTDPTCLFISALWWITSSRGKRTWRISVRVILSHARCSICTGSRLNVNWMSNFFLFIYGILDKIMGKNVSRQLSSLSP